MSGVRKALLYSFLGANTITAIQFAATLVIARLLTPEEIGIYSVAAVFVGLAGVLRDFGVNNYVVQVRELTPALLRSALGLMILTASVIGLIILSTADIVAGFYREDQLSSIMRVLALNILLAPLGAITLTVARRQMRFRELALVQVASAIVSATVSIILAMRGHGPMSLALGGVAGTLTIALLSLWLRTAEIPWIPSLRKLSEITRFGLASSGANIIGYANMAASDLILGRLLNMEAVGIFNRAVSLTQFVSQALSSAINPVLLPWLSEMKRQNQHPRYGYSKVIELNTGVIWPIMAMVAMMNDEIILVLFGNQWGASASLVPFICVSAGIGAAYGVCSPLYNSIGKPSADLIAQSVNLPLKIGAIIYFAAYGLEAVAAAWPWVAAAGAMTHSIIMRRYTDIRFTDTIRALRKSAVLCVSALLASWATLSMFDAQTHAVTVLITGTAVAGLSTLLAAYLVKHPVSGEITKLLSRRRV